MKNSPDRLLQFAAYTVIAVFVVGFFFAPLGLWTGPILTAWFIGTQKPWRGFLLLAGLSFFLNLLSHWRASPLPAISYLGWTFLIALISVLPYLLYRLTTHRQQGFLFTLSLPLWGVALLGLAQHFLPPAIFALYFQIPLQFAFSPVFRVAAILGPAIISFLIHWFAAVLVWMWINEFSATRIATGTGIFAAIWILVFGYSLFVQTFHPHPAHPLLLNPTFAWICLFAGVLLLAGSLVQDRLAQESWANKVETVRLLRSPYTAEPLEVTKKGGRETLLSKSGEQFPVRNGIPAFLEPAKLSGSNQKYNRLYEIIGGSYDDVQRVACALRGLSSSDYLQNYMRFVEAKPDDLVLETSVGTGLNLKYLPRGAKLYGLDLSPEMLAACQANLRRWNLSADLFQGNAEDLPFADNSFDVIFHVGGINFFNDRAKAIKEMIRVAKPGTRIMIADETEEHVKNVYERAPVTSGYFKNRHEAVAAPVDLVPAEMQEVHLELLRDGRFYALTFRKPAAAAPSLMLLRSTT